MRDPYILIPLGACLVVLFILMWGIGTLGKGGEYNRKNANKIMRYRLIAQFIAVIIIVGYVAIRGKAG